MNGRRGFIIVVALYVLANVLIWVFADADARLGEAADGGSWYRPALALMTHGAFVDLEHPTKIDTYRPPLYPLFEAGVMTLTGSPSPAAIALAQIVLLLFVGLLFRDLVRDVMPGWENLGLATGSPERILLVPGIEKTSVGKLGVRQCTESCGRW